MGVFLGALLHRCLAEMPHLQIKEFWEVLKVPRIVPSQVVTYIDANIPKQTWNTLGPGQAADVSCLILMIDKIPEDLLSMNNSSYSDFLQAVSSIREQLKLWKGPNNPVLNLTVARGGRDNAISRIYGLLGKCADEAPAPATTGLLFITDDDLRESLRIDIGAAFRALANGEWKAATVVSGS